MKVIYNDGTVNECPKEEELHVIRHTAAHIMAQAIKRLYPEADFGYGPATDNGFYYDVDFGDKKPEEEDLAAIEQDLGIVRPGSSLSAIWFHRRGIDFQKGP